MNEHFLQLYLKYLDELSAIRARSSSKRESAISAATKYGAILIKATIFLNSAALLAIPLFLAEHERLREANESLIIFAAGIFVLGIFLGAICGFITYYNWILHANLHEFEGVKEEAEARVIISQFNENKNLNGKLIKQYKDNIKEISKKIDLTLYLSWAFGWLSCFAFIGGCVLSGWAFIQSS